MAARDPLTIIGWRPRVEVSWMLRRLNPSRHPGKRTACASSGPRWDWTLIIRSIHSAGIANERSRARIPDRPHISRRPPHPAILAGTRTKLLKSRNQAVEVRPDVPLSRVPVLKEGEIAIEKCPAIHTPRQDPREDWAVSSLDLGAPQLQEIGVRTVKTVDGRTGAPIAGKRDLLPGPRVEIPDGTERISQRCHSTSKAVLQDRAGVLNLAPNLIGT